MKHMIPGAIVHQAVRAALSIGKRSAPFATRRAIAARYGVAPTTVTRWVRAYAGMSPREIEIVRTRLGTRYRKSEAMYAITPRYDSSGDASGKSHCTLIAWQVSLERAGRNYTKQFSVARNGGRRAALRAAQAWRDRIVATHRTISKRELAARTITSNTSGVSGVSVGWAVRVRQDGTICKYRHWLARKPKGLGGNMTQRTFGVMTHGEDGAFELAVKARRAWEAQLRGHHTHHAGVARIDELKRRPSRSL